MMATRDTAMVQIQERPRVEAHAGSAVTVPWHRVALGAILLLAVALNFWGLARLGYGNDYYAAAVRSMMESWHNFFFNSFDPGGFVTIDKPPLGFWFQVLSAKLFGYNGVSLLLPSALAGILSVWLLYHLVGRLFGHGAGLLAALAMAIAPVAVASNRSNIIDSILVLFLLLGAWALSLAAERGSLRRLLLCAGLVGLGFNIKMLEAYLVVPAFALVYLLGAPIAWWKRIAHLVLAGVVLLVVSLSWAVAVDLTPASQRPWVDSTNTNSELDLAIGYNGLQRLTGQSMPGGRGGPPGNFTAGRSPQSRASSAAMSALPKSAAVSPSLVPASSGTGNTQSQQSAGAPPIQTGAGAGSTQRGAVALAGGSGGASTGAGGFAGGSRPGGPGGGPGGGMFGTGQAGPLRLFGDNLAGQDSWLLPLALIGLLAAALGRRVRLPLDRQHQGVLLWGTWLLTVAGFFSVAGFFHPYYLVTLAPAIAALVGIGVTTLWQQYRIRRRLSWLLAPALLATAVIQVKLLQPYPHWSRWLTPLILALDVPGAAFLILAQVRRPRALRLWAPLAAAAAVLALLLAPATWAAETATSGGGGMTPSAGPAGFAGPGFGGGPNGPTFNNQARGGVQLRGQGTNEPTPFVQGGGTPGGPGGDATANSGLLSYLEKHQGTTKYLVAVQDSNSAASYIIQTGKPVMSLGGFLGNDPILTLEGLKRLIKNNTVRYFSGVGSRGSDNGLAAWIQTACKAVPATAYGGSTSAATDASAVGAGPFPLNGSGSSTLSGSGGASSGMPSAGAGFAPNSGAPAGGRTGGFAGNGGFGPGGDFGGGQQLYDCAGAVK